MEISAKDTLSMARKQCQQGRTTWIVCDSGRCRGEQEHTRVGHQFVTKDSQGIETATRVVHAAVEQHVGVEVVNAYATSTIALNTATVKVDRFFALEP